MDEFICKYCGKICKNANSLRNHERLCKQNPNKQESPFVKHIQKIKSGERIAWNKGKTKDTCEGIKNNVISKKQNIENGITKPSWTGKHLSDEHKKKLSIAQTNYLISNNLSRWSCGHSSIKSYPETYFGEILCNFCEEQYIISGLPYRLDFANVKHKIAIEIDGEQHYINNELIERDKIRDSKLKDVEWTTIRIRWSLFQKMNDIDKCIFVENLIDKLTS